MPTNPTDTPPPAVPEAGQHPTAVPGCPSTRRLALAPLPNAVVVAFMAAYGGLVLDPAGGVVPLPARVGVVALAVAAVGLLVVVGRRRVLRALGDAVDARRRDRVPTARVLVPYVLGTVLAATPLLLVGEPWRGGTGVWTATAIVLGVVALSPAGVWTVVLDGDVPAAGALRILGVLPMTVLGVVAGLAGGWLVFIAAATLGGAVEAVVGDAAFGGLVWWVTWSGGIVAGTVVSTVPVWWSRPGVRDVRTGVRPEVRA